ncbi:MAG: Cys-tRNA(Pro) deacylase [Pseudomonadota bacterium]
MTPAIQAAKKAKIWFFVRQYDHDPNTGSYGQEAVEKLGLDPQRVFKTLIVDTDTAGLCVAIVPVPNQIDFKAFARAVGSKKTQMAEARDAERSTGYILGGISPLGQKKHLPTVMDISAMTHETIFISAGRRGLDMEIAPADLAALTRAVLADIGK